MRDSEAGPLLVTATSCRTVRVETFVREIEESGLTLIEKGICSVEPQFDRMMYAVVKK